MDKNPSLNNIKKFEFTEILGWSVSRFDKFNLCKRQYWYDYYPRYDKEFPPERLKYLKALTSIPLETGNIVHDTVKTLLERLLESEKPVDKKRFLDFIARKTEEYCAKKNFFEVHYGAAKEVDVKAVAKTVSSNLLNFLESPRYDWIIKKAVTNKQGWVIEPPGYGETRIKGMKAYCKVDFLFPVDGSIYILDWKTGKQDPVKHKKQLTGYATWASYHFGAKPGDIHPIAAYMSPKYSEMEIKVNELDVQEFASTVSSDTGKMYEYCADPERNVPKEKETFKKTDNMKICNWCSYRELCW
ncbi:MAG: PD-(D/E)XK nuclease family protein [Endomicrobiales bacterium]|nr:PD-(D/E)XK nuclease family protein [Endomicrobiales bacterium]